MSAGSWLGLSAGLAGTLTIAVLVWYVRSLRSQLAAFTMGAGSRDVEHITGAEKVLDAQQAEEAKNAQAHAAATGGDDLLRELHAGGAGRPASAPVSPAGSPPVPGFRP